MGEQLNATVELINDKLKYSGTAKSNEPVIIDYIPPLGDGEGYMSLELFLLSLASCSASSVIMLLRKMKKNITGFKINAKGNRREIHPTSFENIMLEFIITSDNISGDDVEKAIKLSEDTYCPVWAMIKNNVAVSTKYEINCSAAS